MDYGKLLNAGEREIDKIFRQTQEVSHRHFGKRLHFYAPSFVYYKTQHYCSSPHAFPSISITGSSCSLKCKHCNGIVLGTMYPARSPKKLLELCKDLKLKGANGCLISGGCLPDGSVPLGKFVHSMAEIKENLGLTLLVHTGIVNEDLAKQLKRANVDAALIDVIGSNETIREIYNLNVTVADYEKSLIALRSAGIPTIPHVLVGLHYGKLKGELDALRLVEKHQPSAVIIIAFMPIHNTAMEKVAPPSPLTIGKVIAAARLMMPSTPVALGCMRPRGLHRAQTDVLAIKAGVNAIAFPATEAIELAERLRYNVSFSSSCCSQMFQDLKNLGSNHNTALLD
jgi:uncharacterized radical SAM superfamily protein